jgi:RNA polymerase sigma factor (TIGR02999 family)
MSSEARTTDVLKELRSGRRETVDHLFAIVYDELREIARRQRAPRDKEGTLDTTGLVHEAYLNLVDQSRASWNDRAHFLALAAVAMRHILTDRAKARVAVKRGGGVQRPITLDEHLLASDDQPEALLQFNDALDRLGAIDARLLRVVESRFFGGLTNEEIAEALSINVRTVERDWVKAKTLLRRLLAS